MTQPDLAAIRCYQCGQSKIDSAGVEHPMIHIAFGGLQATTDTTHSLHLDCLPKHVEDVYRPQFGPVIDAAKAGTRGDDLRTVMQETAVAHEASEHQMLVDAQAAYASSPEGLADIAWQSSIDPTHPIYAKVGA